MFLRDAMMPWKNLGKSAKWDEPGSQHSKDKSQLEILNILKIQVLDFF